MADLVSYAIDEVRGWETDEPRALLTAAAALLRQVFDSGSGFQHLPDWLVLREALGVTAPRDVTDVDRHLDQWDALSNQLVEPLHEDRAAMLKIGITVWVTRTVRLRIHREEFPDLAGLEFREWKERLCRSLDKHVGFYR